MKYFYSGTNEERMNVVYMFTCYILPSERVRCILFAFLSYYVGRKRYLVRCLLICSRGALFLRQQRS